MSEPASDAVRVRRLPERGHYDRDTVHAIVDEAPFAHVGIVGDDGQPFVIPTIHARIDDRLYLHGSPASRLLRTGKRGVPMCVTMSILDGLVLARSAFHHSMNYRSVVVLGTGEAVTDPDEKMAAFEALVEHVAPDRWANCRQPNETEIKGTLVVGLPLDEASAKIRAHGVADDDDDLDLDVWAGVVPVRQIRDAPVADAGRPEAMPIPEHIAALATP